MAKTNQLLHCLVAKLNLCFLEGSISAGIHFPVPSICPTHTFNLDARTSKYLLCPFPPLFSPPPLLPGKLIYEPSCLALYHFFSVSNLFLNCGISPISSPAYSCLHLLIHLGLCCRSPPLLVSVSAVSRIP